LKLPRDLDGVELARKLCAPRTVHQRLTTQEYGQHHITIPLQKPLRIGTLAGIMAEVADHFGSSREELIRRLFG
jgi:hypothetical protein